MNDKNKLIEILFDVFWCCIAFCAGIALYMAFKELF